MKKLISLLLALCLSVSLAACQGKSDIDENAYDIEGVVEITYSEIDPVCDEEGLRTECEKVLTSMQESDDILLSFVVDSSILIEENELGKYDHLVMVNPAWIEKYDDMSNLQEVSIEDISAEMREFLEVQMPVWTVGGLIQSACPELVSHFLGNLYVFVVGVPRIKVFQIDGRHL
jgi:uncharacterized lipoprotein YehR (DUF1307 family)